MSAAGASIAPAIVAAISAVACTPLAAPTALSPQPLTTPPASAGGDLARDAVVGPQPLAVAPLLHGRLGAEPLGDQGQPVLRPQFLRGEVTAAHQNDRIPAGPFLVALEQGVGRSLVGHLRRRD